MLMIQRPVFTCPKHSVLHFKVCTENLPGKALGEIVRGSIDTKFASRPSPQRTRLERMKRTRLTGLTGTPKGALLPYPAWSHIRFGTLISDLAIQAVKTVCIVKPDGRKEQHNLIWLWLKIINPQNGWFSY